MEIISVTKIWDQGEHNAFTDLTAFNGALYCVFREGSAHVSPDGALRILKSCDDGETWHSSALITSAEADLRDGKLVVFQQQLYLFGGATLHNKSEQNLQSYYWQSKDGKHWSSGQGLAGKDEWLWRVTVHEDCLYGVAYHPNEHHGYVALYRSDDGQQYTQLKPRLNQSGYVNESGLVFDCEGKAWCLLRRDPLWQTDERALLGEANPPYTSWQWHVLDKRIGGPVNFIWQGRHFAVVRLYDECVRTSIVEVLPSKAELIECLTLPSGGDTSYAGIIVTEEVLRISYYSSHEGKCAIYFAKVLLC
ncbi:sialidase family protein [Shewanella colwelliana]|uniref:sialidase family protein n=1 Tax=Shewanella colwelliana TaxID=23 RepID=UPI0022AE946F|nr:sialidase family protein [Shewanella colwelliana]MCZ4336964.1 sialidase family protein [Shewanella colwelliana]